MRLGIVVAMADADAGIGYKGGLPWPRLTADMAHFARLTTATATAGMTTAVIMGRKTWESLPGRVRPLPGRVNVVLSRSGSQSQSGSGSLSDKVEEPDTTGALWVSSLPEAVLALRARGDVEAAFVIGGVEPYLAALASPEFAEVHVTHVHDSFFMATDVGLPQLKDAIQNGGLVLVDRGPDVTEGPVTYHMARYARAAPATATATATATPTSMQYLYHDEHQYLKLVHDILERGVDRADRTGTGTLSLFGNLMRFSLEANVLPLLTTKRVFWRAVAEELLWFISGSTDARVLQAKGIRIWDGNSTREFLDSRGLTHLAEGDLGPVYGFQWRHFGAEYTHRDADYTGQGVDQLRAVIATLKSNPADRRMVLSAWNPVDVPKMALPPCHMFAQFYAAEGALSCLMYQRSADVGLGVPFNIASYALLTRLVAQVTGLRAKELVYVTGDTHIYKTHVEALRTQAQRPPRPFPTLDIDPSVMDIDAFTMEHLTLRGYDPHGPLPMPMAV